MQTLTQEQSITISAASEWTIQFKTHLFNRKPRLSQKSIDTAQGHIRVFSKWHERIFNAPFEPNGLTHYALQLFRTHSLDREKVKAATWNSRHWALGLFCQWISMPHLMHDIEQKSAGRVSTKHRSLTQSEYNALMRHLSWISEPLHNDTEFGYASNIRIHAEIVLMNQAGLRVGEIPTIEIGDITINERSGSIIVRTGKGDKERTVQLNLLARQALTAWLQVNINAYPTDKLFGLRTTRSIQRDVEDIASAINIPDLTCHWLRYDLAKRLERNNTPLEAIRDILGHTTIEQTKRYLRSSAEDIQSALESVM